MGAKNTEDDLPFVYGKPTTILTMLCMSLNTHYRIKYVQHYDFAPARTVDKFIVDPNFAALPTYPVVLTFKGDSQELNLFADRMKGDNIPGMPRVDPNRIV